MIVLEIFIEIFWVAVAVFAVAFMALAAAFAKASDSHNADEEGW